MPVTIEEVKDRKGLKNFIKFPIKLYKGNTCYVPPVIDFEISSLSDKKNPAFEHCRARYWVARKGKEMVGRIAAIIHEKEAAERSIARFGWVDFTDDEEVSGKLLDTVAGWAAENGLKGMHGPLGFTDLDFEGTLIAGFDQPATQATIYNYPYYQTHFEKYGLKKACDWVELRGTIPDTLPKRLERTASIVASRFHLRAIQVRKAKELLPYAQGVFDVLNESYSHLYGYYPLTQKQIDYYVKMYFGFIRTEYVSIIVNEADEVIAFAISLPSLSRAFQKAKGYLFPFGFIHVLKAFRSNKLIDMFLIGVKPEYQKLGANALIFHEMLKNYIKNGAKKVTTGPMLEDNRGVLNLWNDFRSYVDETKVRRRCFIKQFNQ